MKAKHTTLQFLFDRHLARRFAQRAGDLDAGDFFRLAKSLLAGALLNPGFLVKHMRKYDFLGRQISTQKGLVKPQVISIECGDEVERRALSRAILAVTVEIASAMDSSVLPDATTVFSALIECWITDAMATKHQRPKELPRRELAFARPAKRYRRDNLPPLSPQKKVTANKSRLRQVLPHPDFPDVTKQPIAWRPGSKGRPPKGSQCDEHGNWSPPTGWKVIRGRWHPSIAPRETFPRSAETPTDEAESPAEEENAAAHGDLEDFASRLPRGSDRPPAAGMTPASTQDDGGLPANHSRSTVEVQTTVPDAATEFQDVPDNRRTC